ncbi:MAG: DUF2325 domain-containing protein [Gallionellaceae bacterium]|nr:DUF2325 domain-containing protein [Gallionellaceae bacterium]
MPPVVRETPRRRKLWEIANKYHCPIVGTCLTVEELRKLARRAGLEGWDSESDYTLHSTAVGLARDRNELSEPMQKWLERKFEATVKRFAKAKSADELLSLWRMAMARGEAASALWAALSHGLADERVAHLVYEDIHMLSHQVGAASRADLAELARLRRTEAELTLKLERQLERHAAQLAEKEEELRSLGRRLASAAPARENSGMDDGTARQRIAELEQRLEAEAQCAARAEKRCGELAAQAAELNRKAEELQGEWEAAEEALTRALTPPACRDCAESREGRCASGDFSGRCILCVGGRSGLADHYRSLVERSNGRFVHHDGGLEDNPKRLQILLCAADAVICPADNVSHGAYYVVKRLCKQYGKPCVLLKRSGLSTFARGLAELAENRP